jgi:hypothetical protein
MARFTKNIKVTTALSKMAGFKLGYKLYPLFAGKSERIEI